MRGPFSTPITPLPGSFFHADPQVEIGGSVLMVGAPWDTMTLVHHADHLAAIPDKRTIRIEVPFAGASGTEWRFMEEFETGDPVHEDLPDNYIEQIVTAYVEGGEGNQNVIGAAPSLLVDARLMLDFAIQWLEAWADQHKVSVNGAS
ncbi:AAC(3) family N-acetyltransferase [Sphingomonas sp. A2-49]|uniref:AAC(3) family N-acetyltransferase n=1 Tax=Sphingomonas sp. A2-49 TaxID=1391375 RepID=UPI0021CE80FF|nr:AAC(3) family N-acetyltransferase [Sphingomonas sp. A2-49]MCU6453157.1 AAC(3) family N-acetyltransferase [Sphingomonas sp. A2-49]